VGFRRALQVNQHCHGTSPRPPPTTLNGTTISASCAALAEGAGDVVVLLSPPASLAINPAQAAASACPMPVPGSIDRIAAADCATAEDPEAGGSLAAGSGQHTAPPTTANNPPYSNSAARPSTQLAAAQQNKESYHMFTEQEELGIGGLACSEGAVAPKCWRVSPTQSPSLQKRPAHPCHAH
jgi:hypothetical protein